MDIKTCPKCGAQWIGDQHYWTGTNKKGNDTELASLVCDKFGDDTCINPCKGTTDGKGWEERMNILDNYNKELNNYNERS
jgi:hypothetical protein